VTPKPRPALPHHPLSHGVQPSATDAPLVTLPDGAIEAGVVIGMPRMSSAVGLAVEVGRAGHGWAGALVFNLWLRRQMRERRMSQRRLAMLSGVNHSTISRLIQNGRTPSLQTASKLAHALRMQWTDEQVASYFDLLDERPVTPMQRVEAALRGDEGLSDEDVRMLMSVYLKRRTIPGAGGPEAASSAASLSEPPPLRRTADP
jgi:transcriptional regulator with XRE-family HTH domain